ncbi:MAG: ParB/RepB/Spo0J family partition protein [Geodermatophilaceae bacterium]|nr:ParB/RepB/Spo0J family partition protein [Geodermatophilaceae bacterium]
MSRPGGLGRGLGALIPTSAQPHHTEEAPVTGASQGSVPGASYREVPLDALHPNPRQPRQVFDEDALAELTHSIREFGLLQPVVARVRELGGYELIMGERRWRAARDAGLATIPAIIRNSGDDTLLRDALLENIHRADLNPLEEAAAYEQLLGEFGVTHEELAARLGRSRSQVTNTIRLLRLPLRVQTRVAAGVLSAGHARALLAVDDPDAQDALATRIVAEGLSVRATEEVVALGVLAGGVVAPGRPRTGTRRVDSPGLQRLAAALGEAFDTHVKVELGRRRGKIVVEFGSIEDLERLVTLIAPDLAALATAPSSEHP